ncbi:MAG: hypothetical protein MUE97_04080 [Phycisphaerales bacterium]|jgi:hypothetical protein|nr:hypothetical protein [Phycisphaerales bacterium]
MRPLVALVATCSLCTLTLPALAGIIPPVPSQWAIGGSTSFMPDGLLLTGNNPQQVGIAYMQNRVAVRNGFDVRFNYGIGVPGQNSGSTGEGLAFVIQNQAPLAAGAPASGLGVVGLQNALVIMLRTGAVQSLDVRVARSAPGITITSPALASVPVTNQQLRQIAGPGGLSQVGGEVRVRYEPGRIRVELAGQQLIDTIVNLDNINGGSILDGAGSAFMGFSAATSQFRTDQHMIGGFEMALNIVPAPATAGALAALGLLTTRRRR